MHGGSPKTTRSSIGMSLPLNPGGATRPSSVSYSPHAATLRFEEPVLIPAGQGFTFQCEYDNTTDHLLMFGVKATDEMCILFGVAWSPDGLNLSNQSCEATTVPTQDMDL